MFLTRYQQEQLHIIDIQLTALLITLITTATSLFITYNDKLSLTTGKSIISTEKAKNIAIMNRVIILGVLILFLYINYETYNNDKEEGNNLTNDKLQLCAATLIIIAGIIALYVTYSSRSTQVEEIENPEI